MFQKIGTFLLTLALLAPGPGWAASCHDSVKALHGVTSDPGEKLVQGELDLYVDDALAAAKAKAKNCDSKNFKECNEAIIEEAMNEKRFGERFKTFFRNRQEKTCVIGKQRLAKDKFIARSNMALNLGAGGLATWGFYEFEKSEAEKKGLAKPEFQWAFLGASVTFVIYRSIIQCRNELDTGSLDDLTAKQKFWTKFWRYAKMNAIANSIFVSMLMVQDWTNGEDPLDPENLKSYGLDFAFGMVWDSGWAVSHIKFFDSILLSKLPRMRRMISINIQRGLLRPVIKKVRGKKVMFLVVKAGTQVPGFTAEALSRIALTAGRTAAYLQSRSKVLEWAFGVTLDEDDDLWGEVDAPNIAPEDIAPTE